MAADSKPISLYPLTPEEALRRAMRAPLPNKSGYKPPEKSKAKEPPASAKPPRKSKPATTGSKKVTKKG